MNHQPSSDLRPTVLLFTKPSVAGRVKTRLVGVLTAEQAAQLHAAFLTDLVDRLSGQRFTLVPVWALDKDEAMPTNPLGGQRQVGGNLGARMRHTFTELLLADTGGNQDSSAIAIGSDLPQLAPERIEQAFLELAAEADVVLGPAVDGGYYLIGLGAAALRAPLFEGIAWSTDAVLAQTLERCRVAGLKVALLPQEEDIDTAEALERFAARLAAEELPPCPRTAAVLAAWRRRGGPFGGARLEDVCVS